MHKIGFYQEPPPFLTIHFLPKSEFLIGYSYKVARFTVNNAWF